MPIVSYLKRNLLLILAGKVDEMVILCPNQERNGRFVKPTALPVPLLDRIQCTLPCQVKHEKDSYSVVAYERKHVDELSLTTEIPDGEGNLCVANRDGLFHKVDTLTQCESACNPRPGKKANSPRV